jgi:glutamine amidotransferase
MTAPVHIVRTGTANVAAVAAAFRRLGRECLYAETATDIDAASFVVLPGVGAFASGMAALERAGMDDPLRRRVEAGRPTLAICLGLQLLCDGSEEADGRRGLRCARGTARRFPSSLRVPHLGWNEIVAPDGASIISSGVAYYANSYRLEKAPPGWQAATSRYGDTFVAAIERGAVVGCQFHPELSGAWGLGLIAEWLATGAATPGQGAA